jgi:hypothetical protein
MDSAENLKWALTLNAVTRTSVGRDSWLNILLDAVQHYRNCRQILFPSLTSYRTLYSLFNQIASCY